jgi:ribosome-binding factor A
VESDLKKSFKGLISISHVKVSSDLSIAWVDFTVMGAEEEYALRFLQSSRHEITKQLAQKVRLRILPKLRFSPDPVVKRINRIEELIREIHQNNDKLSK